MKSELTIGPSTGWLYARGDYSLSQHEAVLKTAGANSVEIVLANWDIDDQRMLSLRGGGFDAQIFVYRSLHLPPIRGAEEELPLAQEAMACTGATVAVTHPVKISGKYPVEHYQRMISCGVPLALENMDSRGDFGFDLKELEELMGHVDGKFVLDTQHAYEHDHTMGYAKDLLWKFFHKLTHLHVSGETSDSMHSLVHKADNHRSIIDFVGRVLAIKKVPLILEGAYSTPDELQREIEFVIRELDSDGSRVFVGSPA